MEPGAPPADARSHVGQLTSSVSRLHTGAQTRGVGGAPNRQPDACAIYSADPFSGLRLFLLGDLCSNDATKGKPVKHVILLSLPSRNGSGPRDTLRLASK